MVGGEFGTVTVIENAARLLVDAPSLTRIMMFANVPSSATVGVPLSRPVAASKLVHDGGFVIEKLKGSPSGSLAVG
jgi:hypothetical protein